MFCTLHRWIKTLDDGIKGAKLLLHRQEVALVASVTPEKIRLFDEKVLSQFLFLHSRREMCTVLHLLQGPIALYDFVLRACESILPVPENVT